MWLVLNYIYRLMYCHCKIRLLNKVDYIIFQLLELQQSYSDVKLNAQRQQ